MARDSRLVISVVASRQYIPWAHARRFLIAALIAVLLLLGLSLVVPNHAHARGSLAVISSASIVAGALVG